MSGRIVYEVSNQEFQLPVPIVTAEPANGDPALGMPRSIGDVDNDAGYFFIESVMPGAYIVAAGGTLKSVVWGDKDYTDVPLEVAGGKNITGVVITVTDRLTTIAGTVRSRTGQPATSAGIVIFPADRALWKNFGLQPARIRYFAASTSGGFLPWPARGRLPRRGSRRCERGSLEGAGLFELARARRSVSRSPGAKRKWLTSRCLTSDDAKAYGARLHRWHGAHGWRPSLSTRPSPVSSFGREHAAADSRCGRQHQRRRDPRQPQRADR